MTSKALNDNRTQNVEEYFVSNEPFYLPVADEITIFESAYRIKKTLNELYQVMGCRQAVLARELTKVHEEVIRGSLEELIVVAGERKLKGEITIVIAGCSKRNMKGI